MTELFNGNKGMDDGIIFVEFNYGDGASLVNQGG